MMTEVRTFREEQELTYIEPVTQTSHLADHIRYADDLVTVGLASSIPQVNWRVKDWDEGWNRSCLPAGIAQNVDKRHFMIRFTGPGSTDERHKLYEQGHRLLTTS
eukprot:8254285-Heterocapsa_arctica.AAC.1